MSIRVALALLLVIQSAGAEGLNGWADRLQQEEPAAVARQVPESLVTDLAGLNALRLELKAAGRADLAQEFLKALAERQANEAVLLNLSLSYVDQMQGKNLLNQGNLSTRSQDVTQRLIEDNPDHWTAWYIRGLNNLYWPDWFKKAPLARDYLKEALAIHRRLPAEARVVDDHYALGYLALGDAYALLDQPAQAREVWQAGRDHYPYVASLGQRLAMGSDSARLHEQVRALRNADLPIDTNLSFLWGHLAEPFALTLTGGTLFGPGPLEDQPLDPGGLANLELAGALTGHIPPFNNGAEEPNLPGEIRQGLELDGRLADGAPANEHVDVGFVSLMNGKFNLFLAAVQDGPHQGRIDFFLDRGWHWTIFDDIGIDPGFAVGVVKFRDFIFSTSPRRLPLSRQTEMGAPAGVDRAGSLASGQIIPGRLGDDDFDGHLDGVFNALGRFPFDSVMLPGAPFAQTRTFTTDIPVTGQQAALLTLANGLAYLALARQVEEGQPTLAADLAQVYRERLVLARRHGEQAGLADELRQGLEGLAGGPGDLCDGWQLLETAAPRAGLIKRDFDGNGIDMVCDK